MNGHSFDGDTRTTLAEVSTGRKVRVSLSRPFAPIQSAHKNFVGVSRRDDHVKPGNGL